MKGEARLPSTRQGRSSVAYGIALASTAAAVIHIIAAGDHHHLEHTHVAAFFIALAAAQIAWAGYVAVSRRRDVLVLGLGMNASVIAVWLVSRTVGIPLVPGLGEREPVGALDATSTLLEVAIVAGLLFLFAPTVPRRVRAYPREVAAAGLACGLVVLALPPVLGTPIGGHQTSHGGVLAIAHGHGAPAHQEVHAKSGAAHPTHAPGHSARDASGHAPVHTTHAVADGAETHGHVRPAAAAPRATLPDPRGVAEKVRYGPFNLRPAGREASGPAGGNVIRMRLEPPCYNCYLTAMEPDLVYGDGSRANFDTGAMLHHAVIGDASQSDLTCGRGTAIGFLGRRFFAAGNERTAGVLPAPYGYRVSGGDWWAGIFEIMNFKRSPQTVWFEMTVHHLPASDQSVKPVTPVWLDVDNCASSEYAVTSGYSEQSWDWKSRITGRVVFAGGHVHNWGRRITLSNATTKAKMCKSVAGYGRDPAFAGNIESMSVCSWDRLGTVREGETLRITAAYDSPKAQDDVMGIVLAYVHETKDLGGGTQAPESMTNPPDGDAPKGPSHDH
jgi:hypothetical protein